MPEGEATAQLIASIFESCRKLSLLSGRPVSPDGHLVGSLGEIFAAETLQLTLMPPSNFGFDALDRDGQRVEIKTTTRTSIAISNEIPVAQRLVVVVLSPEGSGQIAYDGPMSTALSVAGAPQKNGQRRISLSRLFSENSQ